MNDVSYEFTNLIDLIENAEIYKKSRKRTRDGVKKSGIAFNKDYEKLIDCLKPLKKLNNLIGMDEIKKNIIDQILFYAQNLNTNDKKKKMRCFPD